MKINSVWRVTTKYNTINTLNENVYNKCTQGLINVASLSCHNFLSILLVGIVVLSILMHIKQLISHSVSVPLSNTRVHQQSNHSNNYICEVVTKSTTDVVNCTNLRLK